MAKKVELEDWTFGGSQAAKVMCQKLNEKNDKDIVAKVNRFLNRFFAGVKEIKNMPKAFYGSRKDIRENILLSWKEYNFSLLAKLKIPEDIKSFVDNIVAGYCRKTLEGWSEIEHPRRMRRKNDDT